MHIKHTLFSTPKTAQLPRRGPYEVGNPLEEETKVKVSSRNECHDRESNTIQLALAGYGLLATVLN